ncbi:MAG: hypothetical protein FWD33_04110, partial [Alphaproteobacteria bacterium]|nr:hypothetical protein [Alphaproteobacteria bacterium]
MAERRAILGLLLSEATVFDKKLGFSILPPFDKLLKESVEFDSFEKNASFESNRIELTQRLVNPSKKALFEGACNTWC